MIDWAAAFREFNALGLYVATRYLATVRDVKDPEAAAEDAVQTAWLRLWGRGEFSKAVFTTCVLGICTDIARASHPIELRRGSGKHNGPSKTGKTKSRTARMFPVQVFGCALDEVTMEEEIRRPACGDE